MSGGLLFVFFLLCCTTFGQETKIERCAVTYHRCTCGTKWEYEGQTYSGCDNPDNDAEGLWCMVDIDTCLVDQVQVESQILYIKDSLESIFSTHWDRCNPDCEVGTGIAQSALECHQGNQTLFGCSCQKQWNFFDGVTSGTFSYCENAGDDPGGKWCKIDESQGCDFSLLDCLNQKNLDVKTGEVLSYWDYCNEDCGGIVRPDALFTHFKDCAPDSESPSQSTPMKVSSGSSTGSHGSSSSRQASSGAAFIGGK